jgi:hypothetical protein
MNNRKLMLNGKNVK